MGASRRRHYALLLCAILLAGSFASHSPTSLAQAVSRSGDIWLQIDTRDLTLTVMQGDSILRTYDNIAIGSNGPTWNKQVNDEKTPLGNFTINGIRPSERFALFLAIDYPTMEHAQRALEDGRLNQAEFQAIRDAWNNKLPPPQDTRLGGQLGIHGLGLGSVDIHNSFNWTDGCIALTNAQVEELAGLVRIGTRVSVR